MEQQNKSDDDDGFDSSTDSRHLSMALSSLLHKHSVKHTCNAIHSQGWHYFFVHTDAGAVVSMNPLNSVSDFSASVYKGRCFMQRE